MTGARLRLVRGSTMSELSSNEEPDEKEYYEEPLESELPQTPWLDELDELIEIGRATHADLQAMREAEEEERRLS
jgi:hypothetical protein